MTSWNSYFQTDVYVLGRTYLQLSKELCLKSIPLLGECFDLEASNKFSLDSLSCQHDEISGECPEGHRTSSWVVLLAFVIY